MGELDYLSEFAFEQCEVTRAGEDDVLTGRKSVYKRQTPRLSLAYQSFQLSWRQTERWREGEKVKAFQM